MAVLPLRPASARAVGSAAGWPIRRLTDWPGAGSGQNQVTHHYDHERASRIPRSRPKGAVCVLHIVGKVPALGELSEAQGVPRSCKTDEAVEQVTHWTVREKGGGFRSG